MVSSIEAEAWLLPWIGRVSPKAFVILGGEPTLNPQLPEIIAIAAKSFPCAEVQLWTNGFFINRWGDMFGELLGHHKVSVCVTVHSNDERYMSKIVPQFDKLMSWASKYGFHLNNGRASTYWTRRHHGTGEDILPFQDHDPRSSWSVCPAKYCHQVFHGMIWKCPPTAYINLQLKKYKSLDRSWSHMLNYKALPPWCTDQDLESFFNRREEDCCSCCPAKLERFDKPVPL